MASETKLETTYCKEIPSGQTALDIFKGTWKSALPPEFGLRAGAEPAFFQDPRVFWAQKILPSGFQDLSILELGPFEGYAAYLMEQLGAKNILAIEGNTINFLKCLVIKDVLRLRAEFLCGDFLKYFHSTQQRFDLIWASGILYHSESPWELLNQITEHTDRVFSGHTTTKKALEAALGRSTSQRRKIFSKSGTANRMICFGGHISCIITPMGFPCITKEVN